MTDDDAGGGGGKNGDFWMTSFVNDPILLFVIILKIVNLGIKECA